jgi:hypothetical protein
MNGTKRYLSCTAGLVLALAAMVAAHSIEPAPIEPAAVSAFAPMDFAGTASAWLVDASVATAAAAAGQRLDLEPSMKLAPDTELLHEAAARQRASPAWFEASTVGADSPDIATPHPRPDPVYEVPFRYLFKPAILT